MTILLQIKLFSDWGWLFPDWDLLFSDWGWLFSDWDLLFSDRGLLFSDRGSLFSDRGSLFSDRGSLFSDRGLLFSDRGSLFSDRGSLFSYRGSLFSDRGLLFSDRGLLFSDRGLLFSDWGLLFSEVFLTVLWLRFILPWLRFSVLFPHLQGKCQGKTPKDGARPALFHISCYLCCSVVIVKFYVLFVCVNVYCHRVTTQLHLTNILYHKFLGRTQIKSTSLKPNLMSCKVTFINAIQCTYKRLANGYRGNIIKHERGEKKK